LQHIIVKDNYVPMKLPVAISWAGSELPPRNGIAAESPQDLHWQIRGLGAESPVFLGGRSAPQKMRPSAGSELSLLIF
jgi:hypothetical protein